MSKQTTYMDKNKKENEKTFDNRFWKIFIVFAILVVLIMILPALITKNYWFKIDFSTTGPIGDTIGGIMGPFIAIAAAILTFLAFWVQYKANEQQRKDLKIERFENKFYELLQLHKSNVNEMNIANTIYGRKCFVNMFYELKCIYKIVEDHFKSTSENDKKRFGYHKINLMSFSYSIFFYGIGINSEKHFVHNLNIGERNLFDKVKKFLEVIQKESWVALKSNNKCYTYGFPTSGIPDENTVEFYYFPFDGHANRLGHYYRHLFQTANYIISQNYLSEEEKYDYIKTLRAQLSNFEQLHVYYNSIAWFDDEWRIIFTKYRFIKNLPMSLADFYSKPEEHYKKEIEELSANNIAMFEWLE